MNPTLNAIIRLKKKFESRNDPNLKEVIEKKLIDLKKNKE